MADRVASDEDMHDVAYNAGLLGADLQRLYVKLGLESPAIEAARQMANSPDFRLQAIAVLQSWRNTNESSATTRTALLDAIQSCGLVNARERLQKEWNLPNSKKAGQSTKSPDEPQEDSKKAGQSTKSPDEPQEGQTAQFVCEVATKHINWKQNSRDRSQTYKEVRYTTKNGKTVTVYIQSDWDIPKPLTLDSRLQYGWNNGNIFLVLHDKEQKPYQHRFCQVNSLQTVLLSVNDVLRNATGGDVSSSFGDELHYFCIDILQQIL